MKALVTVVAACGMATLMLAACGGSEDGAKGAATVSSAPPSTRAVTAHLSGRTLSGVCSGRDRGGPPVVLEGGNGGGRGELTSVESHLAGRTVVCAYDRAGVGGSDPASRVPRPVTDVLADLDGFIAAAKIERPYFLVGQSAGAVVVFMQAQAHRKDVAGFVSMNPAPPPYTKWITAARKVESKSEIKDAELPDYRGKNNEGITFTANDSMLTDPLPATMPYAVMFDEDCDGRPHSKFCRRILDPLTKVERSLAEVGRDGRFVRAKGAGHNIYETKPKLVEKTIDQVYDEAARSQRG